MTFLSRQRLLFSKSASIETTLPLNATKSYKLDKKTNLISLFFINKNVKHISQNGQTVPPLILIKPLLSHKATQINCPPSQEVQF